MKIKDKCYICNYKPKTVGKGGIAIHHINGRNIPNYNSNWNLLKVCHECHTKIHQNDIKIKKWILTSEGYKLWFINENGEEEIK